MNTVANNETKGAPGRWRIEFCMPLTKDAGFYASRTLPNNETKEWLLRRGKPARFPTREQAEAAIAKATT